MECCYVVLPPEKHGLSSDRFYRERRSMGKWRSTMTFLGNMLNEEFDETTRNWWQIQCWKPMDSSREWLWYFLNLGMYSWGYIYIYHQLNIVVGSEKGGYLSSWLWHVMNLWTFNRKQDDRNHPHIRWGLPGRISLVPATAWILESRGQDHGNQTRPVAFPDEITRL